MGSVSLPWSHYDCIIGVYVNIQSVLKRPADTAAHMWQYKQLQLHFRLPLTGEKLEKINSREFKHARKQTWVFSSLF